MTMRKRIGEYFLDVSKLVLGGAVLSTVLKMESVSKSGILITSIAIVVVLSSLGFFLISEE